MAENIRVTLVLRPPETSKLIAEHLLAGTYNPNEIKAADIQADSSDVQAATAFANSHNLEVLSVEPASRTVQVAGSSSDIEKAFGIVSENLEHGSIQARDYKGPINLPAPLDRIVIAVLGLDQTPIARHHA